MAAIVNAKDKPVRTKEQPVRKRKTRLRAKERFEEIIAVSAELFSQKGYHGTSLEELGERLGVQKAALYHYVRGKEDILIEIYDRTLTEAEQKVLPIAKEPFPPDERLRRMISKYVELMLAKADMWSLLHYQQSALPEEINKEKLRRYKVFEKTFETVIKEGQEAGIFKPMPARLMTFCLFGMCNYTYQWIKYVQFAPEDIAGIICEVLERGFMEGGGKRIGAWPRYAEASDAMMETAAKLAGLDAQIADLKHSFERDRLRLLDSFVNLKGETNSRGANSKERVRAMSWSGEGSGAPNPATAGSSQKGRSKKSS